MITHKRAGSSIFVWIFIVTNFFYVSAQVIELTPVPCDEKSVEKFARLGITYINEDRQTGYKFALNRITNVQLHAQVSWIHYFAKPLHFSRSVVKLYFTYKQLF